MITIHFDEEKTTGVGVATPSEVSDLGPTEKRVAAGLAFKSPETGLKMFLLDKAEALVMARELLRLAEAAEES